MEVHVRDKIMVVRNKNARIGLLSTNSDQGGLGELVGSSPSGATWRGARPIHFTQIDVKSSIEMITHLRVLFQYN